MVFRVYHVQTLRAVIYYGYSCCVVRLTTSTLIRGERLLFFCRKSRIRILMKSTSTGLRHIDIPHTLYIIYCIRSFSYHTNNWHWKDLFALLTVIMFPSLTYLPTIWTNLPNKHRIMRVFRVQNKSNVSRRVSRYEVKVQFTRFIDMRNTIYDMYYLYFTWCLISE